MNFGNTTEMAMVLSPVRSIGRRLSLSYEFRALDKNQDGRVSPDEFLQGEKLFRSLVDRNHDGFITWGEYSAAYGPSNPADKCRDSLSVASHHRLCP